jgi:DnaJ like chaperone protein
MVDNVPRQWTEPDGVWGKIIGGVAGFALGGPFGAVVGAAFGHAADRGGLSGLQAQFGLPGGGPRPLLSGKRDQAFAVGIVVLSAKLCKCDGPVHRVEIDTFKRCFRIPAEAVRDIGRLFDRAKDSNDEPFVYATELGLSFAGNPGLLEDVLAALFTIARSDGAVNRAEERFLRMVWQGFGLGEDAWERTRDSRPRGGGVTVQDAEDPYAVLGVRREMTDEDIRGAWRQLMRQNHPDSLASRGGSAEAIKRAGDKVAKINAAWDRIKRERRL